MKYGFAYTSGDPSGQAPIRGYLARKQLAFHTATKDRDGARGSRRMAIIGSSSYRPLFDSHRTLRPESRKSAGAIETLMGVQARRVTSRFTRPPASLASLQSERLARFQPSIVAINARRSSRPSPPPPPAHRHFLSGSIDSGWYHVALLAKNRLDADPAAIGALAAHR
jgi:hypothetical protein